MARQDAERRENEPQKWLEEMHAKRKELVDKIKAKKQLREQLSDRRSHASQLRMKSIAALASDAPPPKRRRKGQDGMLLYFVPVFVDFVIIDLCRIVVDLANAVLSIINRIYINHKPFVANRGYVWTG